MVTAKPKHGYQVLAAQQRFKHTHINGWRLASAFGSRDSVGCYQAKEKVTGTFVIFCMINHITSWEHAIPDNPEKMTVAAVEFALAAVDLNVSMGTTIPVGALS